jgi:5'-methylthioadenosine phosphorylase
MERYMNIGIICGHEIKELMINSDKIDIETEYGNVIINYVKFGNNNIYMINRHGINKNIPPHNINYRANIKALNSCKVENIISIFTVGSMKKSIRTGDFLIPDDFIDFTRSRCLTYFENDRIHIDMNNPFCPSLRELLIDSCKNIDDTKIHNKGIYLTTEGPRLETASEIKLFKNYADIVGMTLVPEIILARELGLCYTSICVICNMATGFQKKLTSDEISNIFLKNKSIIFKLIKNFVKNIEHKKKCECSNLFR